jgi:2-oxoglutarate ferredoxin oxidoreductase subunit beta
MKEALQKSGLSFVEIISPCPTLYGRRNKLGDGLEMMRAFKEQSTVKNGADTRETGLDFKGDIVCGKFIDRERPTYLERYNERMTARLGASYKPYEGVL